MVNSSNITAFLLTLPPETKGKVFESYCKWFLENDPRYAIQLKKVWLWKDWPGSWGRDKGIDLIAETHQGQIWAIQAKAYDQTKDYYITKDDVDKFLSESSRKEISFRLLMATTNNIGPNALEVMGAQEKPVGSCLLDKLDASVLNFSDFLTPSAIAARKEKRTPRRHQKEALQAIKLGFQHSPRGQVHMACGTGKTLVGLWLAEQLQSKTTLVLVPSISLISQLYEQWASYCSDSFKFHPLFVCSDKTVYDKDKDEKSNADEITNLGFPVTTDAMQLLKEFSAIAGAKVIFSTYQSSGVIKEICSLDTSLTFDLVISDEAHRCAGKVKSEFSTVVNADAIRAHRKLFMTATPKLFSDRVKSKAKEFEYEIVSMDDETQFGPVFHKLPFSQAIQKNLLSDYQVIISVMDDTTYRNYAEKGRFVFYENYETDARTLASQLLMAKVIQKLNLKKIISFHNRTKSAKDFIRTFTKSLAVLRDEEKPIITYQNTISGDMPQSERHKILKQFAESDRSALIANVKCLSEGIDVPALDGIAFIDPRGSEIDIIQAVGRAIRKAPDKKIGTIIIPIFIDGASDEVEHLENSCFKPIWQVIRALRSHDDMLAEELDNIRLELGGRTYKSVPKLSKVIIDLPIGIGVEFGQALNIKLIENIIQHCTLSWNYQFNMLKKFRELNPEKWPLQHEELPEGNKLGVWYGAQKHRFKNNMLKAWQVEQLMSIDFIGDIFNSRWNQQYAYLKEYRIKHPFTWPKGNEQFPKGNNLAAWCHDQRENFKNNRLEEDRISKLNLIKFPWDPLTDDWNLQFNFLKEYRELFPNKWPSTYEEYPLGNKLGRWCSRQRQYFKDGLFIQEPHKIEALNSIEFAWNKFDSKWNEQFEVLETFRISFPDRWPMQREEFPKSNKLGQWLSEQIKNFRKNKLDKDKQKKLEDLGFKFPMMR